MQKVKFSAKKSDWEYEQELKEFKKAERDKRNARKGKKDKWNTREDD